MSDETVVEDRGITVTKAFDRDGFPVPAVTFRVESDRTDPVSIRIVDEIPAEFGIEQIGFHPEYGSEHWTATGDGVVRFERTVDSGEAFTTVYGVKMTEDERAEPFLDPPSLEVNPEEIDDSAIEDVVPKESSDVVRELAGGERASVPGLDEEEPTPDRQEVSGEESEASVAQTATATDDAEILSEGDDAVEAQAASTTDEEEIVADRSATADPATADTASENEILEAGGDVDTMGDDDAGVEEMEESDEGVEDALERESIEKAADDAGSPDTAADIGGDESSPAEPPAQDQDETVEEPSEPQEEPESPEPGAATTESEPAMTDESTDPTSREIATEAETTGPSSSETTTEDETPEDAPKSRGSPSGDVENLAATLAEEIRNGAVDDEDLAVIRDAIGEPTTSESVRLEHLQSRVSDLEAYTDELESFLDENGRARTVLDDIESKVEALANDVGDVDSRVDSAQGEREALRERVNSLSDDLSALDDVAAKIERIGGDLDALEDRVADGEAARMEVEALEDELEEVVEDVADLEDLVDEFQEWRSQLSDLFT